MDQQSQIGKHAKHAIGDQHIEHDKTSSDIGRQFACINRILTKAGTNRALFDNRQFGRQRSGTQQDRQIAGLFNGKATRDLA